MKTTSKINNNIKNEDDLKKKTISFFYLNSVSLGDALTNAAMWPFFDRGLDIYIMDAVKKTQRHIE